MTKGYFVKLSRIFGRQDAEDLLSELILLAWKLEQRGLSNEGYLKQSIRNKAVDFYRRSKRSSEIFAPIDSDTLQIPEKRAERAVLAFACLVSAIEKSPRLITGICEGRTMREMAREMGVCPATIYKGLRRIREEVGAFE